MNRKPQSFRWVLEFACAFCHKKGGIRDLICLTSKHLQPLSTSQASGCVQAGRRRQPDELETAPPNKPLARAAETWYDPQIIMGKNSNNAARDVAFAM